MTTTPNPQDDKELLELAARAAGMDYLVWTPGVSPLVPGEKRINGQMVWNPIHDDGDALRLAIVCNMTICTDGIATVSACSGYGHDKAMVTQAVSECGGNKNAATRRAIVRTAAKIGRQESSHDS